MRHNRCLDGLPTSKRVRRETLEQRVPRHQLSSSTSKEHQQAVTRLDMSENPSSLTQITGSCACGKVKFTATGEPGPTSYCYCKECGKCSGAGFLPFTRFQKDQTQWQTLPDDWHSSSQPVRSFCSSCSSCISMKYHSAPSRIWTTVGCIDQGIEAIKPASSCIFVKEKPPWAALPENVPRYDGMTFPTDD